MKFKLTLTLSQLAVLNEAIFLVHEYIANEIQNEIFAKKLHKKFRSLERVIAAQINKQGKK